MRVRHLRRHGRSLGTLGVTASAVVLTLVVIATPARSAPSRSSDPTATECAATLACSAAQIARLDIPDRLEFVRAMERGPGQKITAGFDRWRNIEGVLEFFRAHDWGATGTWASTVDAAILAGAEHGLALALGKTADSFDNPGAEKWASYLTQLGDDAYPDRAAHDKAWGEAEQASTDWGMQQARRFGHEPSVVQHRWYEFTEQYRAALRNRPSALDLIATHGSRVDPNLAKFKVPFYDWATDVRTDAPARHAAEAFYDFARFDVLPTGLDAAGVFVAYLPSAYDEFRAETGLN